MKGAFARRHPAVNVLFFVLAALPSALNSHPLILLTSVFAALAYSLRLRGRGALCKSLTLLILPVVLTSLVNGIFNHYGVTTLYTLPSGNRMTLEAFAYGAAAGTAIAAMLLWFVCWNEVVTEDKFMCLFGRVAPHTALLVLMILRFVPLYSERFAETVKTLGAGETKNKRFARLRIAAKALSGVVTWALERSIDTADSMRARGYGARRRTSYSRFRFYPRDGLLTAFIAAAGLLAVLGFARGGLEAGYNPIIYVERPNPLGAAAAAAYALLCFMPIIYDLAEEIRWNRSFSKI